MKKTLKLIVALALVASMVLSFASCDFLAGLLDKTQGIDKENHIIHVGNTAATTGAFASVGVPFNYAQEAYFWYFTNHTDGYKDATGNKYTIQMHHYDDEFNGEKGKTFTQKLVEEDKVFALVGHFGSNTVSATVDYLEGKEIPMVYGVCGVSDLYNTEANIMTVQPIYDTEGQSMTATAFAPVEAGGLGATKLGVISTTDEAGKGMLNGIKIEVERLGKTAEYREVGAADTDYTAAVTALKTAGCDVVIIAANQAPFSNIAKAFVSTQYENVKIITSYVSANAGAMSALAGAGVMTDTREVYAGAWLVTGSVPTETKGWADFVEFVKVMTMYDAAHGATLVPTMPMVGYNADGSTYTYDLLDVYFGTFNMTTFQYERFDWAKDGVSAYFLNSYAMAGYVSASVFCQGLSRMSGQELTWKGYIAAMETAPVNVPMGTSVSYENGQRVGIDALAVNKYTALDAAAGGSVYRGITDLKTLEDAIK